MELYGKVTECFQNFTEIQNDEVASLFFPNPSQKKKLRMIFALFLAFALSETESPTPAPTELPTGLFVGLLFGCAAAAGVVMLIIGAIALRFMKPNINDNDVSKHLIQEDPIGK
ncbi:hypothetical protein TRFO_28479 [Tritrichomonas foetus]|uniref:Uncharacterized protein n=1 Tax=Tritrichomonas foetus TaxID=1144522 RepID=A0A1J4JZD3_9EUKA|nr:hypothetical protein TRFO_28479 [Tritrichomonas foetus]|eukprot:OHT04050.1 hypothetical protein TRFO_28479 [Tritrichomonas foetus]